MSYFSISNRDLMWHLLVIFLHWQIYGNLISCMELTFIPLQMIRNTLPNHCINDIIGPFNGWLSSDYGIGILKVLGAQLDFGSIFTWALSFGQSSPFQDTRISHQALIFKTVIYFHDFGEVCITEKKNGAKSAPLWSRFGKRCHFGGWSRFFP